VALRTRILKLTLDSSGSAAGTVSIPPHRYAGVYYELNPDDGTPDLVIQNLNRQVFAKSNCRDSDGVQELTPANEKIAEGEVVVTWTGGASGTQIMTRLFFNTGSI
jgi:hypothetical protein